MTTYETPQEQADAMVADPAWDFEANPVNAVTHSSVRASEAFKDERLINARFWTTTALLLVEASDGKVAIGQSLKELTDTLGVSIIEVI